MQFLGKILGDPNKKELKVIQPLIDKIEQLEPEIQKLSDEELAAKTAEFRSQLALYLKGGMVLENELVALFREVLQKIEPLAEQCTDEHLHIAMSEPRQKIDRNDPENELKNHLQDTLSEAFEKAYENLSPLLNALRSGKATQLAEQRDQWPDEASDPQNAIITLLTEVEPQLKDIDSDLLMETFDELWPAFHQGRSSSTTRDDVANVRLTQFFIDFFHKIQEELVAIKADAIDELLPAITKRYNKQGKTLEDLLPEAFAVVREASFRRIKMRHYVVQLIGGIVLHQGRIAEMRTGEGKTLVATLPVYLNALTGKGVHVVTVNDYLARRDAEWMGQVYTFLGLSVGIIVNAVDAQSAERRAAYQADITYGTNNEFGFDYLRDNMVTSLDQMVQRELNYAIVDEVDNILIDEARTPLIISGQGQESTDMYAQFARWATKLDGEEDYTVEEKTRSVMLTESGIDKIEKLAGVSNIYDEENLDLTRYMENAIKAQVIFKRDKDYIVKDGEVVIVDEFTGRQMPGRRYSEGLHQAIEAKEGVKVQRENHTLATITFQNFFRLYAKLAGMTGTALTEAEEFNKIYKLDVMVIPTNKEMKRQDFSDLIYRTQEAKYKAVVEEIKERYEEGQPVLVGTTSVETSEMLSQLLDLQGIPHHVLNAKHHEREAQIVAQAGRSGSVTIATNMAGRGTDILLGGNPAGYFDSILHKHAEQIDYIRDLPARNEDERAEKEEAIQDYLANMTEAEKDEILQAKIKECDEDHERVVELGGLHIIGTERHESRRIDNQLRGRAGRQGDPGSTRFFLALDDELMRRFAADRVAGIMERVGMDEDTPLESKFVSRFIESAQTRVEGYNFDMRKNVVEYDDVIAKQREVIYSDRRHVLEHGDMHERIVDMISNEVSRLVDGAFPGPVLTEEEQLETLFKSLETWVDIPEDMIPDNIHAVRRDSIKQELTELVLEHYEKRGEELRKQAKEQGAEGFDPIREFERTYLLQVVDRLWMDHIDSLDVMRAGIGFRSVGQRDPLVEFKNEAYRMFDDLKLAIQHYTVDSLLKLLRNDVTITLQRPEPQRKMPANIHTNADELAQASGQAKSDENEIKKPAKQKSRKDAARAAASAATAVPATPGRAARNGTGSSAVSTTTDANGFPKVGRNDLCPCGSGKKYKKCHGA
ncbi:preprotein translocase subunit SecA [Dictyobacter kobayashii]|uniref:Protein translocase subunit SecA n=1 Tax=Dictyobacter kobayashii TaxID=2014872 RepID=A0A402AL00_9CHLR|nr:preprotein translocase subunit SecA [Dictyobacter kobayashii]GCE19704.1 protein translocase subunit SecA [Dictyobacter kobayashii]